MTTELQNKVWSILPKEFKEEVKGIYPNAVVRHPCGYNHKIDLLKYLFGYHNLTSDAEEEEMLTVPRMAIIQAYKKCCDKRVTKYDLGYADCLYNLFGSKCLPDESNMSESLTCSEPKPSEPTNEGTCSFDHIVKDGFRDHNRLHIAAMITASIYSSDTIAKQFNSIEEIVRKALDIADTLIAESEKKHNHGED